MPGRPRSISDERLMAALAVAIGRVGPARLTLADVAAEAGVSTGMLVRRHGTKRGLLLAFLRHGREHGMPARRMREVFEAAADPVEGLIGAVIDGAGAGLPPAEFANHLAFLNLELADDEFRGLLAEFDDAVRAELASFIAEAVAGGFLVVADVDALAAAVNSLRNGTQITWATTRRTTLAAAMRRDLTTLLAPYRTA
ncbi:TetR family transcriptional regulator [Spongiactinospora sp. TRM90649]|uniref:TetR/AcrR family transcriptional regulator n=1 Tax=Spongiactinospora sp. TRM90649 TaxID=3031114 RepID=UPI0023F66C5D|nr:TetR family transcriptional regulator [Spongiactinospora sp. TRM90649]MDF5756822.1 TetR family transcriptional regulator [Spongiactinospora sp. TRM90649]